MCKDGCEAGVTSRRPAGTAKGKGVPVGSNGVFGLAKGTGWTEGSDEITRGRGALSRVRFSEWGFPGAESEAFE